MINSQDLKKIEKLLNYEFSNKDLLRKSFSHPSLYKKQNYKKINTISEYERLEFLGDRVLGLAVSYLIYSKFPNYSEGKMSTKFSYLVQKNFLSNISNELKLYDFIQTSKDQNNNLKNNKSILADTLEAVIGAIFIDGGYNKSFKFIKKIWGKYIIDENLHMIDPKTTLQELSQQKSKKLPIYKIINKSGPAHNPFFKVSVSCLKIKNIIGKGKSIREAEKDAAENFLKKYKLDNEK